MLDQDEGDFLDRLYAASTDPDQWVSVLERFADLVGGTSVWLSRLNVLDGTGSGVIARIDPRMPDLYLSHYAACNPLNNVKNAATYFQDWRPRILTDEDWMPKDDLARSEYYNDFLRPQDIHSTMMVRLAARPPETCVINVNRPKARGGFGREDIDRAARLHPHLIRAFSVAETLAGVRGLADDLAAALDGSAYGVFLLDATGRLRHANRTAERLARPGGPLRLVDGRLSADDADGARRLRNLICAATSGAASAAKAGHCLLPSGQGDEPFKVTVTALTRTSMDVFGSQISALVCVTDPNMRVSAQGSVLRGRFGFTPAETRVALAIGDGASPRQAAARLGVSFHTVRHQLQSIYEKAGVNRQSELVLILSRAESAQAT